MSMLGTYSHMSAYTSSKTISVQKTWGTIQLGQTQTLKKFEAKQHFTTSTSIFSV